MDRPFKRGDLVCLKIPEANYGGWFEADVAYEVESVTDDGKLLIVGKPQSYVCSPEGFRLVGDPVLPKSIAKSIHWTCPDCGLPSAHGGMTHLCGSMLSREKFASFTDDQLNAEWMRRHPNQRLTACARCGVRLVTTGSLAPQLSDDELRAECERRCMVVGPEWVKIQTERDEWRKRAEAAEARLRGADVYGPILGNVDFDALAKELRSRGAVVKAAGTPEAEAAYNVQRRVDSLEAQIKAVSEERNEWRRRAETAEAKLAYPPMVVDLDKLPLLVPDGKGRIIEAVTPEHAQRDFMQWQQHTESGPGIAKLPEKRPDNSIAHLDVDLLCDDE